ncbi:MAG: T9SS type A sorting domain-containing protein [Bacteroidia bacterium]|nr:T9SS type A sorting domain-containing protein [Bacteroidia bacterium]
MKHSMFSRIEKSWNVLQPDLSPGDENVVAIFGDDPISACQPVIDLNREFFPGNDWQIKNQITIQSAQQVNVANVTETVIRNSDFWHYNPQHNSDYVIRAGNRITINPGFRINAPNRIGNTGAYTTFFQFGNQNRVSFQISPCTPFIDDCGFNHEPAMVLTNPAPNVQDNLANNLQSDASSVYGVYIYPNPANNTLHIEFSEEISQGSFVIYSLMGSKVKEGKLSSSVNTTDISRLSEGLYIIQIRAADRIVNYKFVVAR